MGNHQGWYESLAMVLACVTVFLFSMESVLAAQPTEWQMNFQPAATPVMEDIVGLHEGVLWLIVAISLFVFGLLGYVLYAFHESRHKKSSTVTHNTTLEIAWTAIPALILVVMTVPSMKLLYHADVVPSADLTIKATGYQWYWSYEYPDHGDFSFDSLPLEDDELKPTQPRLLAVDNPVVVPVGRVVRLLVAADPDGVIHSWAMPAFGVKKDAVPGRLNETWFKVNQEGTYYGQCSELCGANHAYMPIAVKVVSAEAFQAWVARAREEFASNNNEQTPQVIAHNTNQ